MLAFREAIREYRDKGCDLTFIRKAAAVLLWSGNPVLCSLFKGKKFYAFMVLPGLVMAVDLSSSLDPTSMMKRDAS